jgi:hypothetical protein
MAKINVVERLVVGGRYVNRRGDYVVRSVGSETVEVEYNNGEKSTLNKKVQERILRNMELELKMEAEIKWEMEHPKEEPKNLAEYICFFCSRPGENKNCKLSAECKEKNAKVGCLLSFQEKRKWWEEDSEKTDPKVSHMKAWTEKKVKTLEEMTMDELKAEIARLETL